MSFAIDPKKIGSINDGGRKLKVGSFAYRITNASMAVVKSNNPTGKEKQVIFDLQDIQDSSYNCKVFLNVMSPNDVQCNIAQQTLVAFAEAAGIGGVLKPERIPSFINKTVVIAARETQGKGDKKDQTYINLSTVEAYDAEVEEVEEEEDEEEEEAPKPAAKKVKIAPAPALEPEEEEEEEEEEEAPKPAAAKKRPW